jgi:two-component system, sensor histidine kinase and response regulator
MGFQVDVANNGQVALQALDNTQYDLVLMDIAMPVMDGITATKEIRRIWPNGPKIIAIMAYLMPDVREICLEAGMDHVLIKPIRVNELRDALKKYIA